MSTGAVFLFFLGAVWSAPSPAQPPFSLDVRLSAAIDSVAARNGVSRDRLRVDPAALDFMGRMEGSFRLQDYLVREPLRATGTLSAVGQELVRGKGLAGRLEAMAAVAETGPRDRRAPVFETGEKEEVFAAPDPLEAGMERLFDGTGKRFQGTERERLRRDSQKLDPVTRRALARLLLGLVESSAIRDAAVRESEFKSGGAFEAKSKRTAEKLRSYVDRWWGLDSDVDADVIEVTSAISTLDLDGFYTGGIVLARAVDTALVELEGGAVSGESFQFEWDTPFGPIAIGGSGENSYVNHHCLVVDLGGNDSYRGPGGVSGQEAVSVVLDLGGDDIYQEADSARVGPGGAILGYAGVVDRGDGADTYTGVSWSSGFGFLGMGWIWDAGGNDEHRVQWLGQGAGVFGLGLLLDEDGDDLYLLELVNEDFPIGRVQGFGGPTGIGVLLDMRGSDDCKVEASLNRAWDGLAAYQQGSAAGYEGLFSGGLGILINVEGIDRYEAGALSMGAGIDGGLGVLMELGGSDHYRGMGRSLGFGGRRGMGVLMESEGKDTYSLQLRPAQGLGFGDDLGTGMLEERSGNDSYSCRDDGLGASIRQGAGWFLELGGEDHYNEVRNPGQGHVAFGDGPAWRAAVPGVAVFLDLEQKSFPDFARSPGTYYSAWGEGPRLGGGVFGPRTALPDTGSGGEGR